MVIKKRRSVILTIVLNYYRNDGTDSTLPQDKPISSSISPRISSPKKIPEIKLLRSEEHTSELQSLS